MEEYNSDKESKRPGKKKTRKVTTEVARRALSAAHEQEPEFRGGDNLAHLGHVLLEAEQTPKQKVDMEHLTAKKVETLNREELITTSEKILIDGSSLRQIYETHLIGEQGLRRLVIEYLKGGDLKRQLRHEIIERETDFEKDPQLRNHGSSGPFSDNDVRSALSSFLDRAAASLPEVDDEEEAFYKAKAEYEALQSSTVQRLRRTDLILIAIVSILIIIIITMAVTR